MARKQIALVMCVDETIFPKNNMDRFLNDIIFSIDSNNPDLVVFASMDDSFIPHVEKAFNDYFGDVFDYWEFLKLNRREKFEDCYFILRGKLLELEKKYRIVIDSSVSNKTMTIASSFLSLLSNHKFTFISGEKEDGSIVSGTEYLKSHSFYMVYDDLIMFQSKNAFNGHRFESGKYFIKNMVSINPIKAPLEKLFNVYFAFDNVDYEKALTEYDVGLFIKTWPELSKTFQNNRKALSIINNPSHDFRPYYVLASLINNSYRRFEEKKYDDAIARLYRSLELIAQIRLKDKYDISTSEVDKDQLNDLGVSEKFILQVRENKIGLLQDYKLLVELDDDLGKVYIENEGHLKNAIKYRNDSILAHGLSSQDGRAYYDFLDVVMKFAKALEYKIDRYINETMFPKFDIRY